MKVRWAELKREQKIYENRNFVTEQKPINFENQKKTKQWSTFDWHLSLFSIILKMTRSSEDNMMAVAGEVNQMDVDYGKNFKILLPNGQTKGENLKHISSHNNVVTQVNLQNSRRFSATKAQAEVTSSFMPIVLFVLW